MHVHCNLEVNRKVPMFINEAFILTNVKFPFIFNWPRVDDLLIENDLFKVEHHEYQMETVCVDSEEMLDWRWRDQWEEE